MTSLTSADASHHGRLHPRTWEWWLAVGFALTAAAFGAYGLWIYEVAYGEHPDVLSVGYHTLQLFALHAPHLEHPVPWQLNVGRWLAAAVVLGTVARGFWAVFRPELLAPMEHASWCAEWLLQGPGFSPQIPGAAPSVRVQDCADGSHQHLKQSGVNSVKE